jgi:raffinose/stachyose/melibiose transport system substrate-binding protein
VPRTAITGPRRSRSATPLRALLVTGVLALSACGPAGGDGGSGTEKASGEFSFLGLSDNKVVATTLTSMSTTSCADANAASKLKADSVPQAQLDQKVQLLAGQGALPSMSVAAGTPDLVKEFISGGRLVNISAELEKSGQSGAILPAAADVIEKLYGQDAVYALPNELNIEGIWFNKKIFAEQGITPPGTWDELVAASDKLLAAGVQPFTADGKDGWNVTRFVGAYLFRSLGPDALRKVADGEAKLTDPEYLKAAEEVSALAKSGAFGPGVASTDYNGTINEFLTGKAAMLYMGSWALGNFNDPAQNKIGVDQIGFMPFPAVTGGAGSVDQVPANVGQPLVFSSEAFDAGSAAWLTCLAANYGDTVLKEAGVVSGFKLSQQHDVSGLTAVVQEQINGAQSSVLWFEALFSAKATTVSQTNGGALGNGSVSGEEFMTKVQDALG